MSWVIKDEKDSPEIWAAPFLKHIIMKPNIKELRKKAEAAWEGCHHCDEYDREFWINGYIRGALESQTELPIKQQTQETVEALKEFKMLVNKLSYIANNLGINDSFDRSLARKCLDDTMIAFDAYIQTLIK